MIRDIAFLARLAGWLAVVAVGSVVISLFDRQST